MHESRFAAPDTLAMNTIFPEVSAHFKSWIQFHKEQVAGSFFEHTHMNPVIDKEQQIRNMSTYLKDWTFGGTMQKFDLDSSHQNTKNSALLLRSLFFSIFVTSVSSTRLNTLTGGLFVPTVWDFYNKEHCTRKKNLISFKCTSCKTDQFKKIQWNKFEKKNHLSRADSGKMSTIFRQKCCHRGLIFTCDRKMNAKTKEGHSYHCEGRLIPYGVQIPSFGPQQYVGLLLNFENVLRFETLAKLFERLVNEEVEYLVRALLADNDYAAATFDKLLQTMDHKYLRVSNTWLQAQQYNTFIFSCSFVHSAPEVQLLFSALLSQTCSSLQIWSHAGNFESDGPLLKKLFVRVEFCAFSTLYDFIFQFLKDCSQVCITFVSFQCLGITEAESKECLTPVDAVGLSCNCAYTLVVQKTHG